MEYKRIFKDGIHVFAGKVGTVIISLVDMMILARILTTEQMGKYSLFLMIVNLALMIGLNWSDSSIVRHGREEYVQTKKINLSFWARIYIFIPVVGFFILLFVIFNRQITTYIGIEQKLIITLIIMFILNGLLNFINFIYQSTDQMKKSAYVLLSQKVFYLLCLSVIFFNIFRTSLTSVLLIINISFLLAVILNLITFDFKKIFPYKFSRVYLKKIWSYSWPQLIGFPGIYIINYIDLFVIKKYWAFQEVGTYNIAYTGFTSVCGFIMLIYTLLFPLMVEYKTKKRFDLIRSYIKKIPLFTAGWIVLVLIGLFASKYVIPVIFSTKYTQATQPFNILLLGSIFYFISVCLLPIVNAFDLIIYSQIFNLIKAAINIIFDFILVPKIGIIGAAYGTMISYFVGVVLSAGLLIIKRKTILGERSNEANK